MKCTELIRQDHMILRRGLDILERMVRVVEEGDRIEIFDIRTVLKFLRIFVDEYHLTTEEKVFFPMLLRAAPDESTIQRLLMEHSEERELVRAIETTLNPKHGIGFVRSSRRLILLLRNHLDQEDTVLRSIAERLLSSEEDEIIAAGFRTNQTQSETYANFARLERKYSPNRRKTPIERDRRAHA